MCQCRNMQYHMQRSRSLVEPLSLFFLFDLSDHSSTQLRYNFILAHMLKYSPKRTTTKKTQSVKDVVAYLMLEIYCQLNFSRTESSTNFNKPVWHTYTHKLLTVVTTTKKSAIKMRNLCNLFEHIGKWTWWALMCTITALTCTQVATPIDNQIKSIQIESNQCSIDTMWLSHLFTFIDLLFSRDKWTFLHSIEIIAEMAPLDIQRIRDAFSHCKIAS